MTPMLQLTPEIALRIYRRHQPPVIGGPLGKIYHDLPKLPGCWMTYPPTEITEAEHQSLMKEIKSQIEPGWTCPRCGQKNADWATQCGRCEWEMKKQ